MAGNYQNRRTFHHPLLVLACVVAVCGFVAVASKPQRKPGTTQVQSPRFAVRALSKAGLDGVQAPGFRWLKAAPAPTMPAADAWRIASTWVVVTPDHWLPAASVPPHMECVGIGTADLHLVQDVDQPLQVANVPTVKLLEPTHPTARWFAARVEQLDLHCPAWQLVSPPDSWHLRAASRDAFFRWYAPPFSRSLGISERRYASPPTLLSGPILSSADQRLAMIPSARRGSAAPNDRRWWDERLLDSMRPYFASSLDSALARPLVMEPQSLVDLLRQLALDSRCKDWALRSLATIREATDYGNREPLAFGDALGRLAYLSYEAESLAEQTTDAGLATSLRRARYAMWRRIEVWRAVADVVAPPLDHLALVGGGVNPGDAQAVRIQTGPPVAVDALLAGIERYESQPTPRHARQVALQLAQLADSPLAARQGLADKVNVHYRNANARVAIADDFVNRWLPEGQSQVEPIRDRILGTPVKGTATTQSATSVTLLPDPHAWRLGLELTGHANSQTIAFERTVRVQTAGTTRFAARQQVVIDDRGLRLGPVVADANSTSRFLQASSGYDPLPLVGGIVRSRAASAFSSRRRRAQDEVAAKTEVRVRDEMDRTVRSAASRAEQTWRTRVVEPLEAGGVAIEPIEMQTTPKRLVARVRVAEGESLTAHTPRPRAPSDSLASLQLHETALTNLSRSLDLAGQRLTAQDFVDRLARFAPEVARRELDVDARDVEIVFAGPLPVTFELAEHQLHMVWNVRELVVRGRANRDFKVHVYYTPGADGLVARFRHTKGPFLEGPMRNSQRMRLQTIFGKVFPDRGNLAVGSKYAGDPRLAGLMITQLVIDDGWLGIAVGPDLPRRTAQLDRYRPRW